MAWCKPLLRLTTTLLLMEIFTAASENVTEGSVFAPTTELWPSEPDCVAGESNQDVCACDAQCARYRDCCRSSPHFKPEEQVLAGSPFTCAHEFGYVLYEVQHCPSTWQDAEVRERCERPDFTYGVPLLDAPLTSRSTNITYRNWYCAACNRDIVVDSFNIWNAEFQCDNFNTAKSDDLIAELLSFDPKTKKWGLEFKGERFVCNLQFRPPRDVYSLLRSCKFGVVSQCNEKWMDVQVRNMCESYTARVCHGAATYRNRHCFICNGFTAFDEECYPVVGTSTTSKPLIVGGQSFTLLLDWKRLKRSSCAKSEVFDPIYRVCRKVYMPDCVAGESKQNMCACDAQCARYRDCCRSSPHFKPEEQVLAGSPFTCAHEFGYVLYEVQHCPSTWQGTEVRERCERPDFNYRVPILDAPLTSRSTNITYRNWYCAACHRDVFADSSVIWNAEFQCDDVPDRLESGKSTAELFSFDPETKDWGLEFEGARSVCNLQFRPPLDVYSLLRSCELEVVSQCSKTWMDVQVRNMCESYTARVCHGATTYRNRHCLICNGFSVSEECYFVNEDESYPVSTAMPELPSFTILLDWRRLKRSTCAKSQVYDPIYRICREVYV